MGGNRVVIITQLPHIIVSDATCKEINNNYQLSFHSILWLRKCCYMRKSLQGKEPVLDVKFVIFSRLWQGCVLSFLVFSTNTVLIYWSAGNLGWSSKTVLHVFAYFQFDYFPKSKIDSESRFEKTMSIFLF